MIDPRQALALAVTAVALVTMWLLVIFAPWAHAEPLSLAQGRWFVQHEVHRWGTARPRDWQCWRLSPATVACSFYTRLGTDAYYRRHSPVFHPTLLAERQCCEYVRLWLAGQRPLTPAEVGALGG